MLVSQTVPVTSCPLCDARSEHAAPFNRCVEFEVCWRYVVCRHCGLVYQSRRIKDDVLQEHYADHYWEQQGQTGEPDEEQTALQSGRAEHLLSYLPTDANVQRLLEIGSGAGFLLRAARRRLGARVAGVELSRQFREYCRRDNLAVYAQLDDVPDHASEKFDAVAMSHVLEHVAQPVSFLSHLRQSYLAPTGYLLLEVPNLYAHRSFEATHAICFTEKTLRATLARAGFATRALQIHNLPRSDVDRPLYISALATPCPGEADRSQFQRPNVWLERVKRAYIAKGGPWPRRVLKGLRIGVTSLAVRDLQY